MMIAEITKGRVLAYLAALAAAACAGEDQGELVQADTGPYVYRCSTIEGAGPGQCKSVPPIAKPASPAPDTPWAPWVVDGALGSNEYFGAVTFPLSNPGMKVAGGKVMVAYDSATLHVFLRDIPGAATGSIRIYLDYQRSEGRSLETYALPDGE